MRLFRRVLLLVPIAALASGVAPPTPASAAQGPGVAAVQLAVVFDTPIPVGDCTSTTATVTGSLAGAVTLEGDIVRGRFDISGVGGPWFPGSCNTAATGDMLFSVDMVGTDDAGRTLDCDDVALAVIRTGYNAAIGLVGGTCSLDGAAASELSGSLEGIANTEPPGRSLGISPATGYTFLGTFLQNTP